MYACGVSRIERETFPRDFREIRETAPSGKFPQVVYTLYYVSLVRATGMLPNFVRCYILYSGLTFIPGKVCMWIHVYYGNKFIKEKLRQ